MEKLALLIASILVIGQGATEARAGPEQQTYTLEQIKEMPRFSSIENRRCPKSQYSSIKKRLECKHEVRIELYEKRQERKT